MTFYIFSILILILILIIIPIHLIVQKPIIKEHYESEYNDLSFDDCGKKCKETPNCYAFGHDGTSKCYLSDMSLDRTTIKDSGMKHSGDYEERHIVCNKAIPIVQPNKRPAFHERRSNSFYSCSNADNAFYIHNKDKMMGIEEGVNFDYIADIDFYTVEEKN